MEIDGDTKFTGGGNQGLDLVSPRFLSQALKFEHFLHQVERLL